MLDSAKRKELRELSECKEMSESNYIVALLGVVLYGLIINVITCSIIPFEWVFDNYVPIIIGYLICVIAGSVIANKSNNPIISFVGFNLIAGPVGDLLAGAVGAYAAIDPTIIKDAFLMTAIITGVMMVLGYIKPKWFEKLGSILFTVLLALVICEIALLIMGIDQYVSTWIGVILFTFYIGYDTMKAMKYPHTLDNAVDCALDLYLDIINLFLRLLKLFARSKSRD
jgi:FtsH-binding integral membrane protein